MAVVYLVLDLYVVFIMLLKQVPRLDSDVSFVEIEEATKLIQIIVEPVGCERVSLAS